VVEIDDRSTIGETFFLAAEAYGNRPFLAVPANEGRAYHPAGFEISYARAATWVRELIEAYRDASFGHGHRVALLLENRPEHLLHKLALNAIGACCVPVSADYRTREIAYLLHHSKIDLAIVLASRREQLTRAMAEAARQIPVVVLDEFRAGLSSPARPARGDAVVAESEASVLYTSGTTGRPKGCVLSHGYELSAGAWYATRKGLATFHNGSDRLYNPLPLCHVNASVLSFFGMLLTGNCQIQTDRFQPQRWWREVSGARATAVHYLGVIVPLLLGMPPCEEERNHTVRFGLGAGVEPQLHAQFERRFGFPLIEVWGMTEMVRVLLDHEPPRQVGTRAFGRAVPGIEVRVVDDEDRDVPVGKPGEMLVRHSGAMPRKGFFSGYLDDITATEAAWRGGWFHTGDVVWRAADLMLHFVDRKKNIIRRSGENIAAAEVEALLQGSDGVAQVAVLAVPDEIREEEVLACIVLANAQPNRDTAEVLFRYCYDNLAYYKAPGWIYFTDSLPTTGTQKIQKHQIFPTGTDPRSLPNMFDLRHLKKR
jgi:crotonobetaine/carnitine-CoA ligase